MTSAFDLPEEHRRALLDLLKSSETFLNCRHWLEGISEQLAHDIETGANVSTATDGMNFWGDQIKLDHDHEWASLDMLLERAKEFAPKLETIGFAVHVAIFCPRCERLIEIGVAHECTGFEADEDHVIDLEFMQDERNTGAPQLPAVVEEDPNAWRVNEDLWRLRKITGGGYVGPITTAGT